MQFKHLGRMFFVFSIVLFSYSLTNAQVVDTIKKAADKTKDVTVDAAKKTADVTVDAAKKTADVTTDVYDKADDKAADVVEATPKVADKAADVTVDAAKATGSGAKKIGNYSVGVTENITVKSYEGGKWLTTTTWDGTKWVSKKVWYATKKGAEGTKDFVVGDDNQGKP